MDAERVKARRAGLIGGMVIGGLTLGGAFAVLIIKGDHETFYLVVASMLSFLGGLGLGDKLRM